MLPGMFTSWFRSSGMAGSGRPAAWQGRLRVRRFGRLGWLAVGMAVLGFGVVVGRAGERPNVLLILLDDMGYGDPGCYNPRSRIATPHIDRLAAEGLRFTDAHAAGSVCHPSRYGLLTGSYPWRTDVGRWRQRAVIRPDQETLATLLKKAGYATAMVGKWHLGFDENGYDQPLPGGPVDRGFDSFFGIRASTDIPPYFYIRDRRAVTPPTAHIEANRTPGWSPIQGAFWRAGAIAPDLKLEEVTPRFTEEAVAVIRRFAEQPERPWFLYLAYPSPHTPWLPTEAFRGRSGAGLYGDFVMMVDAMVGRVLETLESVGQSRNTLVILSSDNGPVWYDADVARFGHDAAGGWRGMKGDAWEAGHRVPFIVRWPGRVQPGGVSDRLVCFTDVMATLAGVTGVGLEPEAGPDSFSFLDVLAGRESATGAGEAGREGRTSLLLESSNGMKHLRMGRWKLIDGLGSGGFSKPGRIRPEPGQPAGQLYDLGADPAERHNLYGERPEIVRRLRGEMERLTRRDRSR